MDVRSSLQDLPRDRQDSDDGHNLNCKQIDSVVFVTRSGSWRWQAVPI
jgi:hypothetical protein